MVWCTEGSRGRTDVLVEALGESAVLGEASGELDLGAVADRPVPAANALPGFEQSAGVAQLAQLVGGGQAGDAAAQDDHAGPLAGARWRARRWRRRTP